MNRFPSNIKAYRPIALCGSGAYGSVYLISDAAGGRYALKIVDKNVIGGSWEREFRGLKHYRTQVSEHPNLIKIFHIEDCGDFFYYTMEAADDLAEGNGYFPATLANLIRKRGHLPAENLRETFKSLLDGLEHLHNAKMIHRDIKPDNIIFVNGVPKFGDIGLLDTTTHTLSLAGTQDFVPPEYLLGQEKEPTAEIDIYALGKTLYCAFTGNDADEFPFVAPELLKNPEYRIFNRLVRAACTPERSLRLKSAAAFRKALAGEIGWGYEFGRFLHAVVVLPIYLAIRLVLFLFSRKWILFLLLFLFLVWCGMVIKTYWQLEKELYPWENGFHAAAFKRALKEWHIQTGKYDLYDFQPKSDFSVRHYGERHLVTKEVYLRAKHPGIPQESVGLTIMIGFPEDNDSIRQTMGIKLRQPDITQSTPLKHEYLHEKVFDRIDGNDLQLPYGTEWRNKVMLLPAAPDATLKYRPELPLISEVNLTFDPRQINGKLHFVLTAAEYVPLPNRKIPDVQWKRQMRFPLKISGREIIFGDALYRDQDKTEDELQLLCKPKLKKIPVEDRFCKLSIITADTYCRVYLDGRLIWGSWLAFYGGYFEMRCKTDKVLKVSHFSVYDAGIVQPGEKRRSRLKLPKAPLPPKRETNTFSASPAVARKTPSPELPRSVSSRPAAMLRPASDKSSPAVRQKKEVKKIAEAVSSAVIAPSSRTDDAPKEKNMPKSRQKSSPARQKAVKPPFAPQKKPAKGLPRTDYKYVQTQVAECIARLDMLKEVLPEYQAIPPEEVVIDCFHEHEKGGNVYEFRIPSRKIRAKIRIQDILFINYRAFADFYVGDKKIEL